MNFISGRSSSNLVAASFEVSKVIAQHGKPLSDGDYTKETWLECTFFFDNFSGKEKIIQRIKDLSRSRKTIKDRILKLESDTTMQLKQDLSSCIFFIFVLMKVQTLHDQLGQGFPTFFAVRTPFFGLSFSCTPLIF